MKNTVGEYFVLCVSSVEQLDAAGCTGLSHLFVEFLQSSLLLPFGFFQLDDALPEGLLLLICVLQAQAAFTVLLAQFGGFSLGLIQLRSQASHLGVEGELHL